MLLKCKQQGKALSKQDNQKCDIHTVTVVICTEARHNESALTIRETTIILITQEWLSCLPT
jgi:hypothetical protein